MAAFRTSPKSFAEAAVAAFPLHLHDAVTGAVRGLADHVDDSYRKRSHEVRLLGQDVFVPSRIHFAQGCLPELTGQSYIVAQCLMSRATDGHLRQSALQAILPVEEIWSIPFIAFLIGDYVVEIVNDINSYRPILNREAWVNFVRENRPTMRLLRSRATSYWNCYHRRAYPKQQDYPGLAFLKQLEIWAG